MLRTCEICGTDFMAPKANKTCGPDCRRERLRLSSAAKKRRAQALRPLQKCPVCGEPFRPCKPTSETCSARCRNALTSRRTAYQRGRTQARRHAATATSYAKLHGVHVHRIVAERKLGRRLRPDEVVHHIDGDRRNNDPENIVVLRNQGDHARLHNTGRRKRNNE